MQTIFSNIKSLEKKKQIRELIKKHIETNNQTIKLIEDNIIAPLKRRKEYALKFLSNEISLEQYSKISNKTTKLIEGYFKCHTNSKQSIN